MPNVVLYMMMSYDGYLADENNCLGWMVPDPSMEGDDLLPDSWDTAILGYGGYKDLSAYWPTAKHDDPKISETDAAFADKINSMKKFVFSRSPRELTWNNTELMPISDDASIIKAVKEIKSRTHKDIVIYGGVRIAQTLARLDLIDDYMPVIHPVVIGSGKPLFEGITHALPLEVVSVKHNKSGAVRIHYRRVR